MRLLACLLALLLWSPAALAEIYRWVDAEGRVHFTQDLSKVPPSKRRQAQEGAASTAGDAGPSPVQTFSSERRAARPAPARMAPSSGGGGDVHRIQVSRAGTSMLVEVRVNDRVTAPFLIDTGASDVLVPQTVASRLGLDTGPDARTKRYSTANGLVEHPVVMLDSVALGGARVENVPASVSDSMQVGLLGLSFFNHFTYHIDAASGVVTLRRNGLAETGKIRGGRSEAQWRAEYANLETRLERARSDFEGRTEAKSRGRRRLEAQVENLERQYEQLEEEADRAHVPMAWRRW